MGADLQAALGVTMRTLRSLVFLLVLALVPVPGQARWAGHPANHPAPSIWRELSAPLLSWWQSSRQLPETPALEKSRGTMDPNGGTEATAADPGDGKGTMDPNG